MVAETLPEISCAHVGEIDELWASRNMKLA